MSHQQQQPPQPVAERHGSRWLHSPPSEDQVRDWFEKQTLHEGMGHDPYMGGIVVINAVEKHKATKLTANGQQVISEVERAVFIPYVKADTRIRYFWDLVDAMNVEYLERLRWYRHEEGLGEPDPNHRQFVGKILPVPQRRIDAPSSAYFNGHLPDGFFVLPVSNEDQSIARYVGCSMRVAIYERADWDRKVAGHEPEPVLQGIATKQTKLATRWADDNALMKAETGAVGRALGMAGVLVVGTGVATAEDMQEAAQALPSGGAPVVDREGQEVSLPPIEQAGVPAEAEVAPAVTTPEDETTFMRDAILVAQKELEADHPAVWEEYRAWWVGRKFGRLNDLNGPALKGALVKIQRELDSARRGEVEAAS